MKVKGKTKKYTFLKRKTSWHFTQLCQASNNENCLQSFTKVTNFKRLPKKINLKKIKTNVHFENTLDEKKDKKKTN